MSSQERIWETGSSFSCYNVVLVFFERITLNRFDYFCKNAPIPLAVAVIALFALSCGAVAVAIAGFIPPPALDSTAVEASVFSQYVERDSDLDSKSLSDLENSSSLYKNMLDEKSKEIYDTIESGMRNGSDKIKIANGADSSQVVAIAEAVLLDNPDIFWLEDSGIVTSDVVPEVFRHLRL